MGLFDDVDYYNDDKYDVQSNDSGTINSFEKLQ